MDAARAFLSDLKEINADVRPRLKEADETARAIRAEALARVDAASTLWASQSPRPYAIEQAARAAVVRLERGESCEIAIPSARAVLVSAFPDRKETAQDAEQRERREQIRANLKAVR